MQKFIEKYAKSPYIHMMIILSLKKHFWGHILGTTTERMSSLLLHDLRKAIISQSNMTLPVNYDILGFKVPIKDLLLVEVVEGRQCLEEVKLRLLLVHPSHPPQKVKQLPSMAILHRKYQTFRCFETCIQLSYKGMPPASLQNNPFILNDGLLFIFNDIVFVDDF